MSIQNREQLHQVLLRIMEQASPVLNEQTYRLVGTSASLLHGVDLATNDVDLLAKAREVVDKFDAAIRPQFRCLKPPTYLPNDQQYLAVYEVEGIEVEISTVEWATDSDGMECFGAGPWTHYQVLPCAEHKIPTVVLELRLVSELVRARADRYESLIAYMQQGTYDIELIRRGLSTHGMPDAQQSEILSRLDESNK